MRLKPRGSGANYRSTHARRAGRKESEPGLKSKTRPTLQSDCVGRGLFYGPAGALAQKSNCALNLNSRGSTICVGDLQPGMMPDGEYAGFSASTEFEFVTL